MHISEIEILTDELAETEKFYTETLGLSVKSEDENTISFLTGESVLAFRRSEQRTPTYHFAFNIPCNKIEEAINWVTSKVDLIKIFDDEVIANFKSWNALSIYFYDNNKNILEFIARFGLNNFSQNKFDTSSILSLSEIGIVTDDPLLYAESLVEKYGLPFFDKGPKTKDFVVMGDDNGLFIIAKTGRNWYPTDQPSGKYFTRVKFREDNTLRELMLM